nr:MAG TPA: hypothetical protein [Caudoviricetes sp.]
MPTDDAVTVGLDALDRIEQEESTKADQGETENKDLEEVDNTSEADESNDSNEESETDDNSEGDQEPSDSDDEDKPDGQEEVKQEEKKKELTDEEFEKLARERGYSKKEEVKQDSQEETKDFERPSEIDEETWSNMNLLQRAAYTELPYIVAEGVNGNVKVKVPEQLPEDFQFKNDKARSEYQTEMYDQLTRADKFVKDIVADNAQRMAEEAQIKEARTIVDAVESLQKSGDLPTPKAKAGTKEFDEDPAVVLINKVLEYRADRIKEGSNISVKDAMLIYKALHQNEFRKEEKVDAKGDVERANIARKISGGSKVAKVNGDYETKYYKRGMTTEQVLDRIMEDL